MSDLTANPQNTITLATRERQKLVNLLFECSTMSRKEARDQIVAELPKAIQSSIRRDHQSTKLDIRLILDTCLNYGGGLEELIATVRHYEESSLQMQAVDEFVQELFTYDAKVRKKEQHEKLELTISTINLDEIDLERLYAASVPDDPLSTAKWYYPRGSSKGEILSQMLSRLVDAPIPEGDVPPILKF